METHNYSQSVSNSPRVHVLLVLQFALERKLEKKRDCGNWTHRQHGPLHHNVGPALKPIPAKSKSLVITRTRIHAGKERKRGRDFLMSKHLMNVESSLASVTSWQADTNINHSSFIYLFIYFMSLLLLDILLLKGEQQRPSPRKGEGWCGGFVEAALPACN